MDNLIKKHEASVLTAAALVVAREADKTAREALEKARDNLAQLYHPQFRVGQREVYIIGKYAVIIERKEQKHMSIEIDEIQEKKS